MTQGYTSTATGKCVEAGAEAVGSACAGYPRVLGTVGDPSQVELLGCEYSVYVYEGTAAVATVYLNRYVGGSLIDSTTAEVAAPACEMAADPWALSTDDGAVIAGAIVAVWLSAWAFRAVRSALA